MSQKEVASGGFHSAIVDRYRSAPGPSSLAVPAVPGRLGQRRFRACSAAWVGSTAALSPNTILRLKDKWRQEYEAWKQRPLTDRYVSVYADGLYLKARLEHEKTGLLEWIAYRLGRGGFVQPTAVIEACGVARA